jgi:hypothetical protein
MSLINSIREPEALLASQCATAALWVSRVRSAGPSCDDGVHRRGSWLMLARKSLLAWAASSARAFRMLGSLPARETPEFSSWARLAASGRSRTPRLLLGVLRA